MTKRTKKIIATILLISFVGGTSSTAFAAVPASIGSSAMIQTSSIASSGEHVIVVENSQERGKITITLKALKKLLIDNRDTIEDILIGLNIVQKDGIDKFYDSFMKLIDLAFETNDTIEGVIIDSLTGLGVSEDVAATAANLITHFFF